MANIKITVEGPLMDGHKITFKAPCNCDAVEKLDVRYMKNNEQKSKLFTMKDAHGNDLTGLGNLFYKDAYVDVVLDPNSGSAYLQNAGTNGYLEGKTTPVDNLLSDRADLPLSARQGKLLNESLEELVHLGTITNPTLGQVDTEITLSDNINYYKSLYIAYSIANDVRYTKIPVSLIYENGCFVTVELNQIGSYMLAVMNILNNMARTIDVRTNMAGWENYFNIKIYGVKTL